jgi:hypothetical protein
MLKSHRFAAALAVVALAAGASTAFADHGHNRGHHHHHGDDVLRSELFGSMPGGPVLFEVNPGGAPWVISDSRAEVRRDGRVEVRVEGLVIPTAPQNGTNPLSHIAATVVCNGKPAGTTAAVPFSTDGDARIDARIAPLPRPCLAPAVLLNPAPNGAVGAGTYIAATGA